MDPNAEGSAVAVVVGEEVIVVVLLELADGHGRIHKLNGAGKEVGGWTGGEGSALT